MLLDRLTIQKRPANQSSLVITRTKASVIRRGLASRQEGGSVGGCSHYAAVSSGPESVHCERATRRTKNQPENFLIKKKKPAAKRACQKKHARESGGRGMVGGWEVRGASISPARGDRTDYWA